MSSKHIIGIILLIVSLCLLGVTFYLKKKLKQMNEALEEEHHD